MADDQKELDQKELTLEDLKQEWNKAAGKVEEAVLAWLKEQYQRTFEITRTAVSPGELAACLYARRSDAEELPFLVRMEEDDRITDQYVRKLVLTPFCREAEERFPGIRMTAEILEDPAVPEYDTALTLFEYLRKHGVDRIVADVIMDGADHAGPEELLPFFEEQSLVLGAEMVVEFRVFETEEYERAARMFDLVPDVSDVLLSRYHPLKAWSDYVREGKSDLIGLEVMSDG